MNFSKIRTLLPLAVAVALLLAACGQQPPTVVEEGSARLTLSVAAEALSSQSVTTQGSPYNPVTGATAVDVLHVTVRDSAGALVSFTMDGAT